MLNKVSGILKKHVKTILLILGLHCFMPDLNQKPYTWTLLSKQEHFIHTNYNIQ